MYANVVELETSIKACLEYCEAHADHPLVKMYQPRLAAAWKRYSDSIATSEVVHVKWRAEQKAERLAWKEVATALRDVQIELRRVGAIDFPDRRILYWDEEELQEVVAEMVDYLTDHAADLEEAQGWLEGFERLLGAARAERKDEADALRSFQRFVDLRREAMIELRATIGDFRAALRRTLGKKNPEYLSIYWPQAVSTDEHVLF
ncbi:MAG: hypothetical protein AAGI01_06495 [Myxococcota bacterium]